MRQYQPYHHFRQRREISQKAAVLVCVHLQRFQHGLFVSNVKPCQRCQPLRIGLLPDKGLKQTNRDPFVTVRLTNMLAFSLKRLLEAHPRFTKIMKQPGDRRQQGDTFRTLPTMFAVIANNLQGRAIGWHAPLRVKASQIPDNPQQLGLSVFFNQWQATAVLRRAVLRSSLRRVVTPSIVIVVCHAASPVRSAN